ncbi:hypothetical protein [Prevotella sp. HCN-7019]|jgi:hypothetical protein|uniref:hypothetical protein n=1 Tax=Prevotella sp. HCN-7019 TaxID=3134668 RepID=UPI0030C0F9C8
MGKSIKMGNDEFILYVRKHNGKSKYDTKKLGELICKWLKENAGLKEKDIEYDVECLWGEEANNVSPDKLPKTASQFVFDRGYLPALYNYLDTL